MPRSRRDGPGVAHRRVVPGREAEPDARPRATQAATPAGPELDGHAERLEQVGGAARGRRGPVAVLAHPPAGAGHDERREGADVDRVGPVAAGADHVDHRVRWCRSRPGWRRRAWRRPCRTSSATVSPFIRRATMKAAIWAGLAAPSRISAIATRARVARRGRRPPSACRGPPATRRARRSPGQPWREPTAAGSGRPAALPQDAAALLLGGAAPHAFLLPALEGELQAGLLHRAHVAHHLGGDGLLVGGGIEDLGVESAAGRVAAPERDPWVGGQLFVSGGRARAQSPPTRARGCKPICGIRGGGATRRLRCGAAAPTPRRRGTGDGHPACGPTGSGPGAPSR